VTGTERSSQATATLTEGNRRPEHSHAGQRPVEIGKAR
jgi:hypothetical protein